MKKIILIMAGLLISNGLFAYDQKKHEITENFSDSIATLSENDEHLQVEFETHSAIYKVLKKAPHFLEIRAKLEKLKKEKKKAKIKAAIPKMEIQDVAE